MFSNIIYFIAENPWIIYFIVGNPWIIEVKWPLRFQMVIKAKIKIFMDLFLSRKFSKSLLKIRKIFDYFLNFVKMSSKNIIFLRFSEFL